MHGVVQTGLVLDGRFEVVGFVASGGMGAVFRALDHATGEDVALKIFTDARSFFSERFAHETGVLAELRHPGIVRYVGQGLSPDGRPYLAMEWVEGSTLRRILRARRLTIEETLAVAKGTAEALGEAHRRGIVHRDLKPANLIIAEEGNFQVKVLDFGLAALGADVDASGPKLQGTPGYMSPEQARGESVDGKSDVFSLACVLYECLTQSPAFVGHDTSAVLAKVAVGRPEPLERRRKKTPKQLQRLVEVMLSKDPAHRPDVDQILHILDRVEVGGPWSSDTSTPAQVTFDEERITSVLVARGIDEPDEAPDLSDLGFSLQRLRDGTVVGLLDLTVGPLDSALRGVRAGLRLSARFPGARVTVGLDHTRINQRHPSSAGLEAAFSRLRHTDAGRVCVDEAVAMLAADRMDISSSGPVWLVEGERSVAEEPRPILGKVTPLVGREAEYLKLEALRESVTRERRARCALLVGESGLGKSRLLWGFAADPGRRGALVLRGRGEIDRPEPNGLWLRMLREHLSLRPGTTSHAAASRMVDRGFDPSSDSFESLVAWIDGELSSDPRALAGGGPEAIRRGVFDWLSSELERRPVEVYVDDLQYVDSPSLETIRMLVERFEQSPVLVVAAGPYEAYERLTDQWGSFEGDRIDVRPLTHDAAQQLVQTVLGESCDQPTRLRIIEQAQGNPFVLEELMRAVSRGEGDPLPESVLGLLQARLRRLSPPARRVLRAASVFGRRFSRAGVAAVVDEEVESVERCLKELIDAEVVRELSEPDLPGDRTLRFRHSLLREAAYSSFPSSERQGAHARAADWLDAAGVAPPRTLARHWELAGHPERAVPHYRVAAERNLEAHDLDSALELSRRGLERNPERTDRAVLAWVQAEVRALRGQLTLSARYAKMAVEAASPGSATWFRALSLLATVSGRLGSIRPVRTAVEAARNRRHVDPIAAIVVLSEAVTALLRLGEPDEARRVLIELDGFARSHRLELDPDTSGHVALAHASWALANGDVNAALERRGEAARAFRRASNTRRACIALGDAAQVRIRIGDLVGASTTLDEAMYDAHLVGLPHAEAYLQSLRGSVLGRQRRFDEAKDALRRSIRYFAALRDARGEAIARSYLASTLTLSRDLDEAAQQVAESLRLGREFPPLRAGVLAVSARIQLELGRTDEALEHATEAMNILRRIGHMEEGETLVRLCFARCLHASGRYAEAQRAIVEARERVLAEAHMLRDSGLRTSFLVRVPENARVLALARRWSRGGEASSGEHDRGSEADLTPSEGSPAP